MEQARAIAIHQNSEVFCLSSNMSLASKLIYINFKYFSRTSSDAVHITTVVKSLSLSCQNDHLCFCSPHIRSTDSTRLRPETRLSLAMWSETRYPSFKFVLILLSPLSDHINLIYPQTRCSLYTIRELEFPFFQKIPLHVYDQTSIRINSP